MSDAEVGGVAVVGLACRFPGSPDAAAFWDNLRAGRELISFFSPEELAASGVDPALAADPRYVPAWGVIEGDDLFDAAFFGVSPREAEGMDPQHRLFLECAWEALEDAGHDPARPPGPVGVYAGSGLSSHALRRLLGTLDPAADWMSLALGNDRDYLTTRVSHKLDLKGPSLAVQTACSTSLVAVHLACQGLLQGDCDLALAGGVRLRLPQRAGYLYREGDIVAPDGRCRPFDAAARGTVGGNGVGVVVLRRLADALAGGDRVLAVVRGTAVNNDGAAKIGFTAPGVAGQAMVIGEALAVAGIDPATVGYVEAHGTGTALGDPVEVAALTQAFRKAGAAGTGHCALGSVKGNIGHLDAASGVAGLIKAVLALHHGEIPPTLHFRAPNPALDLAASPFFVAAELRPWPRGEAPRRAGVSSFGLGGTNAHAVLEEAPARGPSGPSGPEHLLLVSARTEAALESAAGRLARHLRDHPGLDPGDVAFTLATGRAVLEHRLALVCRGLPDAAEALGDPGRPLRRRQAAGDRPVAFLFPGQGVLRVGMGRDLYAREAPFREELDHCAGALGIDLPRLLHPSPAEEPEAAVRLARPDAGMPALLAVELALARLWTSWGVRPRALLGHSLGELAAACLAGVFSREEALRLAAVRGRLLAGLPAGRMLSVALPAAEVEPLLGEGLAVAAVNAPALTTVCGPVAAVEELAARLGARGVSCRPAPGSHAFHSPMVEPVLADFAREVGRIGPRPPRVPYLSNVTGDWAGAEVTEPSYWARHLRGTVRFRQGLERLLAEPGLVLLEVGPGRTLATFARQHPGAAEAEAIVPSLDGEIEGAALRTALGRLWLAGARVSWSAVHAGARRRRVALPAYPFERRRFGGEVPAAEPAEAPPAGPPQRRALDTPWAAPEGPAERALAALWENLLGVSPVGRHDSFFDLGGHSLLALRAAEEIAARLGVRPPPGALAQAPTVAALARELETLGARVRESGVLVRLQAGDPRRPPLFCVHPAGGSVYGYRDLARLLGAEQPVLGLQAPELEGPELESAPDLAALAARYAEAVEAAAPAGPVLLCGWSLGGVVAHEMARRLHERGRRVALLALIDAEAPSPSLRRLAEDEAAARASFARGVPEAPGGELPERLWHLFRHHLRALAGHAPDRYPGELLLLRAARTPGDPDLGWGSLAARVETVELPGDHWTVMTEPHVRALAERLGRALRAAAGGEP